MRRLYPMPPGSSWEEAGAAAGHERNMPLCRLGDLGALWRAGGLLDVEERPLEIELSFASFDDYWSPFLGGVGPAGAHVAALDDGARRARGETRTAPGSSPGPSRLPSLRSCAERRAAASASERGGDADHRARRGMLV